MKRSQRFYRIVFKWSFVGGILVASALAGQAQAPTRIVSVEVQNLSEQRLKQVPATFAQAFREGDIPHRPIAHVQGRPCLTQADIKNRHQDGSVRMAIISVMLPEMTPRGRLILNLGNAPGEPAGADPWPSSQLLAGGFNAALTLRFPDGAERTLSAAKLLGQAKNQDRLWLQGPVAQEWLLSGAPEDREGRPDPDLHVQFQVRAYAGNESARVSVVVENCWDTWAGNIRYNAMITVGDKQVEAAQDLDHRPLSRWRNVVWWGMQEPPIHIVHDLTYLSSTGALPHYDTSLPAAPPDWQLKKDLPMDGPDWDVLGKGSLTAYMPTTGGRPEIAPYPAWTVRYLLHPEPQLRNLVLANGDLAGSWPIHVRDRKTGHVLTIDDRPNFWLDSRGQDKPAWKPNRHEPNPHQEKLTPDLAHQGSFAYVPYLLTGDYYFLEEAYFWAGYCLLATWPHPRQGAKGILSGQIRGNAWALRNLADAAWIAPAHHQEAGYFSAKVRNNIAHHLKQMYGPPEFNPLGFWGPRTVQDARIQKPANPNWIIMAPWEHDYLMWSFHHLVELGYAEAARPRDFLLRWRVGTFVHAPDYNPRLATPYRMVVGEQSPDGQIRFYEDWRKLGQENAKLSKPGLPNNGNSYAYSARAALVCGVDGGFPMASEALRWLESHLPDLRKIMSQNPSWAIQPRVKHSEF
jgi:hypothetical protein